MRWVAIALLFPVWIACWLIGGRRWRGSGRAPSGTTRCRTTYIAADIDDLKAENARLRERVRQLVGENAELSRLVDEQRRARAYEEKDWKWLTD